MIYGYRQTENSVYNSMAFAEKAVLNAQSYDVDMLLLPQQAKAFSLRYGPCLLQTYLLRKQLPAILGQQKWQRYLTGCRQIENSLSGALLDAGNLPPAAKKQIRRVFWQFAKAHPKGVLHNYLMCRTQKRMIGQE